MKAWRYTHPTLAASPPTRESWEKGVAGQPLRPAAAAVGSLFCLVASNTAVRTISAALRCTACGPSCGLAGSGPSAAACGSAASLAAHAEPCWAPSSRWPLAPSAAGWHSSA